MKTISVVLSDEQYKKLKKLVHETSLKEDKDVSLSELVNRAIEALYD